MYKVSERDIYYLAIGSSVLGSGGGGNPFLGYEILKTKMKELNRHELYYEQGIADNDFIIGVGGMGSPWVGIEKIPAGTEYFKAYECLSKFLKREASKITSIEIGGINSVVPFIASLLANKPLVDGDLEGRAFPELYMTTSHFYGINATPMCIVDERGNQVILDSVDNYYAEKIARSITVRFGGRGYIAIYPMNGESYIKSAILGSISLSIDIGKILNTEGLDSMLDFVKGRILFHGKVVDVRRINLPGFNSAIVTIEGLEEYKDYMAKLYVKNEYLLFEVNNNIISIAPNIINLVDYKNKIITSDMIKYGIRVRVIGIPVSSKWREVGGEEVISKSILNEYKKLSNL
ncbi:hypothetical protein BFU36_12885 [Sulfolobus sp. A20]|uniref:DUF917 domain-containing protein n=1 Tax=Sulfolobaceae TaxID=118883 RepID=UPI000845FC80|nr:MULTISPECIES: DUF917 domain-containing protein [unclassified Sulfolobus]TRM75747.1 DUF917 domain-containing protein [Sulfolobus sp. B5]TRM76765.1 DUF917 domain-containing protein [Sulfolobus sp. E5]TRM78100.1 DUF917 domain-containing protein [Sulfolobus sp. A20-N-F8]TRM82425.1 DUF917 domain-containing protein [Sulfolobus sp. D5]TRM84400.1 DUF917 domain-containing protein [Sulfolobus sp. F3]TRM88784.1 DUF917 domain-containing protein [Sulfolobus sp. C3]TRN00930.1 DUF917 domain-containing p